MNQVFLLDVFLFIFFLQYLLYFNNGILSVFFEKFFSGLKNVFSYSVNMPMSYVISCYTFLVLLIFCFGGYFSYSFCVCGMLEFTLMYSLVAWFSTVLVMMSSNKVSVYLSKSGDSFLKTFTMLLIEVVSELSRPVALTIRLTVNVMVGHLIVAMIYMGMMGILGESFVWFTVLAIMMECFVFFIQSYIFSRLIYLYLNE
uniref:ATP synthase F0 subunit 6 n=1 Tax=Varestrongylus eleguneniensis TaxID=1258553 RepID=UPI00226CE8D5|nr:ATP synthase F0 subunit 6 [Varestrongylus eleguneniensis]UZM11416.1 ATP synthase F0 subunit 6 [Varestrongylus eleguneniensis]